jgi:hypothetical protein
VKVEFLPEADEEFLEAARYYESEAAGVGTIELWLTNRNQ